MKTPITHKPKEPTMMDQFAILLTNENMKMIADQLHDGNTVESIKEESDYLLALGEIVLAVDILDLVTDPKRIVSYIVPRSTFERNYPDIHLNDQEFEYVWTVNPNKR